MTEGQKQPKRVKYDVLRKAKQLGFKTEQLEKEDPLSVVMKKTFKKSKLNGLHIYIESEAITVYGVEPKHFVGNIQNGSGTHFVLDYKKTTVRNLTILNDWCEYLSK